MSNYFIGGVIIGIGINVIIAQVRRDKSDQAWSKAVNNGD